MLIARPLLKWFFFFFPTHFAGQCLEGQGTKELNEFTEKETGGEMANES